MVQMVAKVLGGSDYFDVSDKQFATRADVEEAIRLGDDLYGRHPARDRRHARHPYRRRVEPLRGADRGPAAPDDRAGARRPAGRRESHALRDRDPLQPRPPFGERHDPGLGGAGHGLDRDHHDGHGSGPREGTGHSGAADGDSALLHRAHDRQDRSLPGHLARRLRHRVGGRGVHLRRALRRQPTAAVRTLAHLPGRLPGHGAPGLHRVADPAAGHADGGVHTAASDTPLRLHIPAERHHLGCAVDRVPVPAHLLPAHLSGHLREGSGDIRRMAVRTDPRGLCGRRRAVRSVAIPEEAGMSTVGSATSTLASLRGVGVRFGGKEALRGVDLDVEDGAFVAVIGPDGAGKSTLLRVLAGLRRPSEGEVTRTLPKAEVGFSGAEFDLYGDLTVMENLRFFASVRGLRNDEFRRASGRILEMVGLTEAADRLAANLSGGMKKKLGLAAALIYEPRLLILDEPTIGVDPTSRRELWGIIAEAYAAGTTVVFATTYLDEAERARRVVLLSAGEATEFSPERMGSLVQGWHAWVLPGEARRNELRVGLAQAGLGPRVYLREEGLTLLTRDEGEARGLAGLVLSQLPGDCWGSPESPPPRLEPATLNLDDLFVLVQMRSDDQEEGRA